MMKKNSFWKKIKIFFLGRKPIKATFEKKGKRLSDDIIFTVYYNDGTISKYKGSSTVFYSLPSHTRCGTNTEYFLSGLDDFYNYQKEQYPDSEIVWISMYN